MKLGPRPLFLLGAFLGILTFACGGSEPPPSTSEPSAAETGSAAPTTDGRDISELDVCALVPGEEVAALFGGSLAGEPRSQIYPGASTECSYAIEAGGPTRIVIVFLYPPGFFELYGEEEEDRQEITGLGDRAYSTTTSGIAQVNVLVEGDVTIDARADTVEDARRLAELTLSKL